MLTLLKKLKDLVVNLWNKLKSDVAETWKSFVEMWKGND